MANAVRRWPLLVSGVCLLAASVTIAALRADEPSSAPPRPRATVVDAARMRMDPVRDGWTTEVLSEAAQKQLKNLAERMSQPQKLSAASLRDLAADDFACGGLRPEKFTVVYRDGDIAVRRGEGFAADSGSQRGPERLAAALRELLGPLARVEPLQVEFKQFRITVSGQSFVTEAYFHAAASALGQGLQQNAMCMLSWQTGAKGQAPRLTGISTHDYEEVLTRRDLGPMFVDCTQSVLGRNACFQDQLLYGQEHWLRRRQLALGLDNFGHHGLAIGDVNGDGLEDIYVCQTGGLPNRLFIQNADGSATEIAKEAGVDLMERTHSALLLDLDNDGDQDLVLATEAALVIFANDGGAKFTVKSLGDLPNVFSLAAADYDADGDLDIYACLYAHYTTYQRNAGLGLLPIPYFDANNGTPNALLRNDGGFKFTEVTADAGLDENNRRWSFAASWEDYDNDGDLDLYVANDFGRNNLYRNDGGTFKDVAEEAGVEDVASGMSVSWGDYNRDGLMDLYVGNMFSSAGGRITYQRRFHESSDAQVKGFLQRLARGNSLFLNTGGGKFSDVSEFAGVTMGRWAWSSNWVDLNNDGWQDLVVANGYITNEQPDDL